MPDHRPYYDSIGTAQIREITVLPYDPGMIGNMTSVSYPAM